MKDNYDLWVEHDRREQEWLDERYIVHVGDLIK